jgi:hypothetical protein
MPQLTFPITAAGLVADVRVNVDVATMQAALAAGKAPSSISTRGLIDTGTDMTAVAPWILQQLGAPLQFRTTTQGIGGGNVPVRLFLVTLFVLNIGQPHLPWLVQSDLLVMELPTGLPFDILIGLDVIRTCKLLVDGPAGQFTLDF